jgi:hypothetical protein
LAKKLVYINFLNDKVIVNNSGNISSHEIAYDNTFYDTIQSIVKELRLKNKKCIITLPGSIISSKFTIAKPDLTKLKNTDKLILKELYKELDSDASIISITYKLTKSAAIKGKIFISCFYVNLVKLTWFLQQIDPLKIEAIDIFGEGIRKSSGLHGDYMILYNYIESDMEYTAISVYRDDVLLVQRIVDTEDVDVNDFQIEVNRTIYSVNNVLKDLAISNVYIASSSKETIKYLNYVASDIGNTIICKSDNVEYIDVVALSNWNKENDYNLLQPVPIVNKIQKVMLICILIFLVVFGVGIYLEKNSISAEAMSLSSITNANNIDRSLILKEQSKLEKNKIFQSLRNGNSFTIMDRVSVTSPTYDKLLNVIYKLIPSTIKVQGVQFSSKDDDVVIIGQAKVYNDIITMFDNFNAAHLSNNITISSAVFDPKADVINFQFKCGFNNVVPKIVKPKSN